MNNKRYLRRGIFALVDYVSILLAEIIALNITGAYVEIDPGHALGNSYMYLWIPFIFVAFFMANGLYHMRPMLVSMQKIFSSIVFAQLTTLSFLYAVHVNYSNHTDIMETAVFPISFVISSIVTVYAFHVLMAVVLKKYHLLYEPVIFIGAGLTAERAVRFYENDWGYRYDIVGFIDDDPISRKLVDRFSVLGKLEQAKEIIQRGGFKTVIITMPGLDKDRLTKLISDIQPYTRNISFCPDVIGMQMSGVEAVPFFSEQMMMLKLRNNLARKRNRIYKRIFDLVFTIAGGLMISPILLTVAAYIKYDSKGSVFYNAGRIGENGKTFTCYKFRSMHVNSDEILKKYLRENPEAQKEWDEYQKLRGYDPRVTKAGEFMRKYSIDELPQIFNVILGNMSLVGPRPYLPREMEIMGEYYEEIKRAIPGITGLWQVSGRNDVTFDGRLQMDAWYVRNWSVWIDLMCLVKTVGVVLGRKGAY